MRRMVRILPATALLLAFFTSLATANGAVPQQRGNQRFELEWRTAPTTYLHYALASQAKIDPIEPMPDGAVAEEPALSYAHYMGHEFDDMGNLQAIHMPYLMEDVLMQLAMQLPEKKKANAGLVWDRAWNFSRIAEEPALSLISSYTVGSAEKVGSADCVKLSGVHDYVAPEKAPAEGAAQWFEFHAETTAWFNLGEGRLEAADITLHSARWRAATVNVAAARLEQHWQVRYAFSKEMDSAAGRSLMDKVSVAISKGAAYMKTLQNAEGAWPHGNHNRGGTALALLTLLTCDVPRDDESVVRGFAAMKGMDYEETYSVSLSLMAYEARYITESERRAYLSEGEKFPEFKRELSKEDREEMQRLVDWLAANQNSTKNAFWNYKITPETMRFDFSNTQYALLGLAAALRCEIKIPGGVIGRLVEQVVAHQQQDGPKFNRVVGYKPPKENSRKEGRSTYASKPAKARGWAYATKAKWDRYTEAGDAYGSMTTAGMTCLLVGLDIVAGMDANQLKEEFGSQQAYEKWKKAADEGQVDGMCWLEYWYSVTRNPNRARVWYLYYMYGLERVMMLAQEKRLGMHDWYAEGASVLVSTQGEGGSWGTMPDTCFALLFLKKGTVPSRKPVTGSK
jgi:hypothetical protein